MFAPYGGGAGGGGHGILTGSKGIELLIKRSIGQLEDPFLSSIYMVKSQNSRVTESQEEGCEMVN